MELDNDRYTPAKQLNRQLLKNPARVSLFTGNPEDNSSGIDFPEAIAVWEQNGNWRAALNSIKACETADRFEREADRIPLRLGQLAAASWEGADAFVSRLNRGELAWQFVPLHEVHPDNDAPSGLKCGDTLNAYATRFGLGLASKKILPYLAAYARQTQDSAKWEFESNTALSYGRTQFMLGVFPHSSALDEPGLNEIIVVPHLNIRGPNGLWCIRRGPNHPLYQTFKGCAAWYLGDSDGQPATIHVSGFDSVADSCMETIEVFSTEAKAVEHNMEMIRIGAYDHNADPSVCPYTAQFAEGREFVDKVVLRCDALDGWGFFSKRGRRMARMAGMADELEHFTLEQLAELFRPAEGATEHEDSSTSGGAPAQRKSVALRPATQ
jgi:hypothetical protein